MIQHTLSYLYYLLIAVLIFNLTQRKHQAKGERKRFASLFIAGGILLLMAGIQIVLHFGFTSAGIPAVLIVLLLYFWYFREKIFIFSLRCPECGTRYSMHQVLYEDSPSCACTHQEDVPATVDDIDWETWKATEEAVLCFIIKEGKILLIHKKTGLGKGKINLPGGRIEENETARDAAVRETIEETGLTPIDPEERVDLSFVFTDGYSLHGKAFFCSDYTGTMTETPEADPFWCNLAEIPYDEMWEDDPLWIPRALKGEHLRGVFIFDGDRMLSHRIETAQDN